MTWVESPEARTRRLAHERELERVGGPGTEAGQALLDRWARESRESMRVTRKPAIGRQD